MLFILQLFISFSSWTPYSLDENYMKGEDKGVEKGTLSVASQRDLDLSWLGSEEPANILSPGLW